ncbi:MAG: peptide chain release factor N(5)-glutamine methyltransferase, partial [Pirellulales bacterium]
MSDAQPWTIGRLLSWTTEYLQHRGSDSPRLDAELLLAEALGRPRIQLYAAFEHQPDEPALRRFRELVKRRAGGEPVAYLLGRREFYSLDFRVTPEVLIPRPESEHLVVTLLDLAHRPSPGRGPETPEVRIADVGTGSGILAVAVAKHLPAARVTATDVSAAALAVARENAVAHGVDDRVELVESDLFERVPRSARFGFIVSNPPYVSEAELERLPTVVRDHEPAGALLAGERGTEVIERLVPQAAERLRPGGHLLIEVSPMIAAAVEGLLDAEPQLH